MNNNIDKIKYKKAYDLLKEIIPNTVKVFEARMLELEKLARAK